MFNVGGPEIAIIIVVALLVLGPQQLPKAMRTFGTAMAEVRKVTSGFQAEIRGAMDGFTEEPKAAGPVRPAEPAAASAPVAPDDPPAEVDGSATPDPATAERASG